VYQYAGRYEEGVTAGSRTVEVAEAAAGAAISEASKEAARSDTPSDRDREPMEP
jgi:hypothetical protein